MTFSKSHIDRLFSAHALPSPPWPFTCQFLLITSRAAGLTAEQHRERLATAKSLLAALESASKGQLAHPPEQRSDTTPTGVHQGTIASLRLEVELERARHTETRLGYALRDAQFLMKTLWSIISALRDIISSHDALHARLYHSNTSTADLERLRDETQQAIAHKHAANDEADRAAARIRALEGLWDQARLDMHRLSLHPDAGDLTTPASDPEPRTPVVPQDLLAQPALDDIAAALNRIRALNFSEERAAVDLEHALTPTALHSGGGDELSVLVAATHLTDTDNRRTALRTLCRDWPSHVETKEALFRLIKDEDPTVRRVAVDGLAQAEAGDTVVRDALANLFINDEDATARGRAVDVLVAGWPGDDVVRDTLISRLGSGEDFDVDALDGLARGWADDANARDALIRLIGDGEDTYCVVVQILAERWAGDTVVRDLLARLIANGGSEVRHAAAEGLVLWWPGDATTYDILGHLFEDQDQDQVHDQDATESIRRRAVEMLRKAWAGDVASRDALVELIGGDDEHARRVAAQGLVHGRSGATAALNTVIQFCSNDNERLRRAAARVLAKGWHGDTAARDAVISLLRDGNERVPHVAARMLAQGWAGDTTARNALILLTQHDSTRVRRAAARMLAQGWAGDATVHARLTVLSRDDIHKYVRRTATRLLTEIGGARVQAEA
ncbi:HEAT repeat domain-containing protein [Streptomyces sp. NBC_00620]|uniref:HEAT repeat domain-containing protein n=1 Tax=Streptomyces sp. NBC_00620 TaxID=2903666 RepID=UPI00224D0B0E|nr:HEAT repeat domain-containing protein [Streptomyces sp. NBC_00620]MCX4976480.1 HEAT repeat domain-containing protein [Streptomyces sp. NBC_00620]